MDSTPIDWRKVLKVYISHVINVEGVDFFGHDGGLYGCLGHLSQEEYDALAAVVAEKPLPQKSRRRRR